METGDDSSVVFLDLVIKLGGAAITNKSEFETLRTEELQQGATLIKRCYDAGQKVAVVHGAGSFGHHQAKEYKVNEGLNKKRDYHGFCVTRNSVSKLNKHVVECLTEHGLPAVACPAFPTWQTCGRAVSTWPKEDIRRVMTAGLIPVFHGDCVLDSQQGCCILSGDTIIQTLCSNFTVKHVVFLTDVSGVYDKPPSEKGSKLLQSVSFTDEGRVCNDVKQNDVKLSSSSHDVTGGMLNKIKSAHHVVRSTSGRTRVFVSKIGSEDSQKLCLDKDCDIKGLQVTEIVN